MPEVHLCGWHFSPRVLRDLVKHPISPADLTGMGLFKKMGKLAGGVDGDLMANGLLGRGVVASFQLTGTAVTVGVEEHRVCELTLQVFLDGREPYVAQVRQRIPEYLIGQLGQGGAAVAVRVSPTDPSQVAVDLGTAPPVVTLARPADGGSERILQSGTPAEAIITQTAPMGVRNWEGHDVHLLTLTVMAPNQDPYQVQVGNPVPPSALPVLFPGSKVPVKVAPGEPNSVAVDWRAAAAV
jgi:hypothetical protein